MSDQLALATSCSPALPAGAVVPAIVASHGDRAAWRYLEFFAVTIRYPNTRAAYARAASTFFTWCDGRAWRCRQSSRCTSPPGSSN